MDGPLLHPLTMRETAPVVAVRALHEHVRQALVDHGDDERASAEIATLLERGNGARVQRALLSERGDLAAVVLGCADTTTATPAF